LPAASEIRRPGKPPSGSSVFKIRDAGPDIVAKVTVCTNVAPGYEQKFLFRVHVEAADGTDARNHNFYG
jgi:hypothetical protein